MHTPPYIPRERVIDYCGPLMYQLGKEFLRDNSFYVYYREWMMLKGICEGASSPSYCVRILFDEKGIANSCCTCYTNRVVPCKHIAALLLLWQENPEAVPERAQWVDKLKEVGKNELISLIEKMVDLYPDSFLGCDPCVVES